MAMLWINIRCAAWSLHCGAYMEVEGSVGGGWIITGTAPSLSEKAKPC